MTHLYLSTKPFDMLSKSSNSLKTRIQCSLKLDFTKQTKKFFTKAEVTVTNYSHKSDQILTISLP